ncbi:hypothetical protein [Methylomagnum sp.]
MSLGLYEAARHAAAVVAPRECRNIPAHRLDMARHRKTGSNSFQRFMEQNPTADFRTKRRPFEPAR